MRFIFLLSLTVSGNSHGGDSKSGAFFRHARRSGRWPAAEAVHRSAIPQARAQLSWPAFEPRHQDAVRLPDGLWPAADEDTWQGLSVFAMAGSISQRPVAEAWRQAFAPDRGLDHPGKGPYRHCWVSTVDDVFGRLPLARPVRPIAAANERAAVQALLPSLPRGGVLRFDRGYPCDERIEYLNRHYAGYGLFRCPAQSTFPAGEALVRSGQTEAMITLPFSKAQPCTLRAVRLTRADGTVSVLLTNLLDTRRFSADAMIAGEFRRWGVETHYCDETPSMALETFPSAVSQEGMCNERAVP